MENEINVMQELKHKSEDIIKEIVNDGITVNNIDMLSQVVDIHKDIANENYWCEKEEMINMKYRTSGRNSYGARRRDSRGRYMAGGHGENYGNYGESGNYAKRYRGHDMIDGMYEDYGVYMEGKEEGRRGNYGAKEDSMEALRYMLQSVEDFMMMLNEEAESQEEVEMIKRTARNIAEM